MRNELLEKYIPLSELSEEEIRELKNSEIKKHDVSTVFLHWFNMIVWMTELITGSALIISKNYAFTPIWISKIVREIFGSPENMLKVHIVVGITWIIVLLMYAFFGWRRYLKPTLKEVFGLTSDDIGWLKAKFEEVVLGNDVEYPPQDSYNGGQKLFAIVVALSTPVIMLTGVVMAFHLFTPAVIRWAVAIHFAAVGAVVMGLSVHIYMALLYPPEQEGLFGMIKGYVSELFLYSHHYKFWRKKKLGLDKPEPVEEKSDWGAIKGGILLGVVLFFAFYVTGYGLGASGFFQRILVALAGGFAPETVKTHPYMGHYWGKYPLWNYLVFVGFGVVLGALYGMFRAGHKFKFDIVKGENVSYISRIIYALLGGGIIGIATRIAGGCTSSQALTGGSVFSPSGWIFMLTMFAGGYLGAFIFRRLWK